MGGLCLRLHIASNSGYKVRLFCKYSMQIYASLSQVRKKTVALSLYFLPKALLKNNRTISARQRTEAAINNNHHKQNNTSDHDPLQISPPCTFIAQGQAVWLPLCPWWPRGLFLASVKSVNQQNQKSQVFEIRKGC